MAVKAQLHEMAGLDDSGGGAVRLLLGRYVAHTRAPWLGEGEAVAAEIGESAEVR